MTKKTFLVVLLIISLSLAGCLDNSTGETSTEFENKELILIDVVNDCKSFELYVHSTQLGNGSTVETIIGVNVTLYHAVYSFQSPNLTFEYDIDMDGSGDVFNNISRGTTTLFVPMSYFSNLSRENFMTTIAATASTGNAHSSELIHIANDCSILSSIDLGQLSMIPGDFSMYDFEVNSAGTTFST
ncbi:MAG: hypothetical protein ACPHUK_02395, partial [Candidatus Poseidoniaceae archaeon]